MEVRGAKAKRGWWWRRLVVTFNFLGVGGGGHNETTKKSKNEKTKNEKTAIRHEDGMAVPPLPPPPLASTPGLCAPLCSLSRPPEGAWARGPSWEQRAGRGASGVLAGATKAQEAVVGGLSSALVWVGGSVALWVGGLWQ